MNQTFQKGYHIVTSYRNSRNYGDNWISAGYGLWFIRESVFLNHPRCLIKQSCCVGGTGFVFSKTILDQMGGWPYHLLTEDIEFSVDQIIKGYRIGYCPDAILYDEQPITFQQSVDQRLRWAKGFLEVFKDYGGRLIQKIFKGNFSCFDMTMNIMPAFVLSFLGLIVNLMITTLLIVDNGFQWTDLETIMSWLLSMYAILFWIGVLTTMTQWKQLHTSCFKKLLYCFSFPVFMFTYLPISLMALFMKVSWKPIQHRGNHLQLSKN